MNRTVGSIQATHSPMKGAEPRQMRSQDEPICYVCGTPGVVVYEGLQDRTFDAPDDWTLRKCTRSNCGLVWLDPMPQPCELWKAYRTYYTHGDCVPTAKNDLARRLFRNMMGSLQNAYLEQKFGYPARNAGLKLIRSGIAYCMPWRRAEWDRSVMFLPHRPGGRMLEIGCGDGSLLADLSRLGWQVEGVDVDTKAINAARSRGLLITEGPVEKLNYNECSFDAIVLSHVIEHVHDPEDLLRECLRILKPGGQLTMVTPNASSLMHRLYGRAWFALEPPRHLHIFTGQALSAVIREAGFQKENVFTTIRDADGLFVATHAIKKAAHYRMRSSQPRYLKILGRIFQCLEYLLMKASPSIGEELTVIASK